MAKTEQDLDRRRRPARRATSRLSASAAVVKTLDRLGALVGLDAGWVVRSATPGLEQLTGTPREHALGRSLRTLLAPRGAEETIAALAKAVQAPSPTAVLGTLRDGRPVVLVPVAHPAPSAEIYLVVCDLRPGQDARGAREAPDRPDRLPDSSEVFRARLVGVEEELGEAAVLLEIAEDLAASLELDMVLPRVVEHAARLCRADVVGLELVDPETSRFAVAAVSGAGQLPRPGAAEPPGDPLAGHAIAARVPVMGTGRDEGRRYAPYLPDAATARFRASLAVPLVADARVLGALVFCRRAARPFGSLERQRAERLARHAALAIRNARLHGELERRMDELRRAQAQVVQAEKLAAVGRLAAGAAHEINNPLAAIVGNAELLLRREILTKSASERVERILQGAYRAARIIKHLLAFVRAHPPDLRLTDVPAVLRDAVAGRARDLELDHVAVVDEMGVLPAVVADPQQLGQVFANILDNALDAVTVALGTEGRTIRLTGRVVGDRVEVRIENSGLPIAEATLPKIFDPFFTTKAVGRGAGLGLSVCQGIVSAHGGHIHAENVPHGVALVVELPLAGPSADAADTAPPALARGA